MQRGRKSIRLPGFDYTQAGAYFVTICVNRRLCLLGKILKGSVQLTPRGDIAERSWVLTQDHFINNVWIDSHITMPNHVHAVIMIQSARRGGVTPPLQKTPSLGDIVAFYKYRSTKQINHLSNSPGVRFWQRNYHDHIIRNEGDLNHHRKYILENPLNWSLDRYFTPV